MAVTVGDKSIIDVIDMAIGPASKFFAEVQLTERQKEIGNEVLKEIRNRLQFLVDVGLDYLTLSRSAPTLSGGEAERIRLASQLGCGLSGVLYILDEPTIGLHQRDNHRLLKALHKLRDLGNSRLISTAFLWVVVVPWVARVLDWLNLVWPSKGEFTLPRNLWAAWFMSWLFVFAQGLYWWRCPRFLKKFGSYTQYERLHGPAFEPLRPMLKSILDALGADGIQKIREAMIEHQGLNPQTVPDAEEAVRPWIETNIAQMVNNKRVGQLNEVFDTIVREANRLHRRYLTTSLCLFVFGLGIFALVALENIVAVLRVSF